MIRTKVTYMGSTVYFQAWQTFTKVIGPLPMRVFPTPRGLPACRQRRIKWRYVSTLAMRHQVLKDLRYCLPEESSLRESSSLEGKYRRAAIWHRSRRCVAGRFLASKNLSYLPVFC